MVTLREKNLEGGETLTFEVYRLDEVSAKSLGRSVGSYERTLQISDSGFQLSTDPRASWYVNEGILTRFHELIGSRADFDRVRSILDRVRSEKDVPGVMALLEELS